MWRIGDHNFLAESRFVSRAHADPRCMLPSSLDRPWNHPLDGPRLKVRRALSEVEDLKEKQQAFRNEADYQIVRAEFNPMTDKYTYRVRAGISPPLEWGVWIGEVAHNLGSALDGLVYQLALLNTNTPANTQFPVFLVGRTKRRRARGGGKIRHFEADGWRMIRDLRPEHQALIEQLQPYKRDGGGRRNPLYLLHEINNADKHRLIQVVGVKSGAYTWSGSGDTANGLLDLLDNSPFAVLKDGARIFEAPRDVPVDAKLVPVIAFWNGCAAVQHRGVCQTLAQIAEHVSEIVESFGSEF